jgi:hypothetical protein
MTMLASNQALYSSQTFATNLATQFSWTTTSTPVAVYYGAPYNTQTDDGAYSIPFYNMPANTPRHSVYVPTSFYGHDSLQAAYDSHPCPIPDPTQISGGVIQPSGTDQSVLITCGNELWEFWGFSAATGGSDAANAGYAWQCWQGGYVPDITIFNGFYPSNNSWGVRAYGGSTIIGLLRGEDYYRGTINHCIELSLPATGNPNGTGPWLLAPATRDDAQNHTKASNGAEQPYTILEGAWFRLPSTFDTAAWAAAHHTSASQLVVEMVCRAIRDYGLVIGDSAGTLQFACEGKQSYGSPYSPYSAGQIPDWGNFGQDLPWSQLQQIATRNA